MDRFLAFDIGGTNCRMAVFSLENGRLSMGEPRKAPTRKVHTAADLYYAAQRRLGQAVSDCLAAAIALAGPVVNGSARLSNADLFLDEKETARLFCMPVTLLNDFAALCHAVDSPAGKEAAIVLGTPCASGQRAVLGAGTGLGCGILAQGPDGPVCLSSEGGHMAFAFLGEEERGFEKYLLRRQKIAWASADDVVSGRGLKALAAYVTGQELSGRECGNAFLRHNVDSPDNRAGRLFARFYGRACRNWALASLCQGGLWISGGIAVKNTALLSSNAFSQEFVQGPHAAFLERVPVYLFRDGRAGLWGAAMAAMRLAGKSF